MVAMERVALSLGGNIGDVDLVLDRAIEMLGCVEGVEGVVCSTRHRTSPWGFGDPAGVADFVNQAVVLDVAASLDPLLFLDALHGIEAALGRDRVHERGVREVRGERYSSRVVDIDIIFWGSRVVECSRLCVPHPLMQDRAFVLAPLAEVAGDMLHPILGRSCRELLEML